MYISTETFSLESYVKRNLNYLNNMVDKDNVPYFHVFWTEPAEAAHDWPDLTDVMARQLQAAVMLQEMTGETARLERIWTNKILDMIDKKTGLVHRKETNYCTSKVEMGCYALIIYMLVTLYQKYKSTEIKDIIDKMAASLFRIYKTDYAHEELQFSYGFIIKGLMSAFRFAGSSIAFEFAKELVKIVKESKLFTPDNTFKHGGHMHGNLRTLMGLADYALYMGDAVLYSRVCSIFEYVSSITTSFGFLPEVVGRKGDIVSCETCALMDYIGLGVTLANGGHPEYWDRIERMVRNHLVESQISDVSWLKSDGSRQDTHQFTWDRVGERMIGGYAGWSSPTHILAACETLTMWGGEELRNKTRAFQNCCGGSGTHAFYIAWKNAAIFKDGCLYINLYFDKLLNEAEIRCFEPYKGEVRIMLKRDCNVRIRIADHIDRQTIKVTKNSEIIEPVIFGNYLELNQCAAGDTVVFSYDLNAYEEEVEIGNDGFLKYRYRVKWRGSTVTELIPIGNEYKTVYSDFDKRHVPVFYGEEGPGRLYLGRNNFDKCKPTLSTINLDSGEGNFWNLV
ncbi:MAG TPA: hypothetical protein GXX14_01835 [Clostridiaceae bacterium]|nr:hypothetical protein [Clostridiaceae bacterium]